MVLKETRHTVGLLEPALAGCSSWLDVGCGAGFVAWELARRFPGEIATVDIADLRRIPTPGFTTWNGHALPFAGGRFDVVSLCYVLHHLPDVMKPLALAEVRRVARRRVVIFEDTPRTALDRLVCSAHGRRYRRKLGSRERFGFLETAEWLRLFAHLGLRATVVRPLPRLCRDWTQPFARTLFVLDVPALYPRR